MGARTAAYWVLVGGTEARRPFVRPRRRSEGNIKMDLQEVGRKGMGLIRLRAETCGGLLYMR